MTGKTKDKYNQIQEAAMQLVASIGVRNLDAMSNTNRAGIVRGWSHQIAAAHGVTAATAKNHIYKAMRRQRNPAWQQPEGWGGKREGAGPKPKGPE